MATNQKRAKRSGSAQAQQPAQSSGLDDLDFDNVDESTGEESPEELEEAIEALADPDSPPPPPEPKKPKWEETANGKTLYVREPIMVQRGNGQGSNRIRLAVGQRVPKGMISRERLLQLGRIGAISVKPPPPPPKGREPIELARPLAR